MANAFQNGTGNYGSEGSLGTAPNFFGGDPLTRGEAKNAHHKAAQFAITDGCGHPRRVRFMVEEACIVHEVFQFLSILWMNDRISGIALLSSYSCKASQ